MPALIPCIMPGRGNGTGLYTVTMDRDRDRGSERTATQPQSRENDAHALFMFNSVIIPRTLAGAYTEEQRESETGRRTGTAHTQRKIQNKQTLISCHYYDMMHAQGAPLRSRPTAKPDQQARNFLPLHVYLNKRKRGKNRNTNTLYFFIGKWWVLYFGVRVLRWYT